MAIPATISYEATLSFRDKQKKKSKMVWNVSAADATAWDADTSAGNIRAMFDAAAAMSADTVFGESVARNARHIISNPLYPTSNNAVNGNKLFALGVDTVTNKPWRQEIPARDPAQYTATLGDCDITASPLSTYVSTVETTALSEDGNAIQIQSVRVENRGGIA